MPALLNTVGCCGGSVLQHILLLLLLLLLRFLDGQVELQKQHRVRWQARSEGCGQAGRTGGLHTSPLARGHPLIIMCLLV